MKIGQGVLSAAVLDVAELDRLGGRIEERERRRSTEHAEQLIDALALHRTHTAARMGLATHAYLALLMGCSEHRARTVLSDAQVLDRLCALGPMRSGLLTVEQARVVVDVLGPLDDALGGSLWERLVMRLAADQEQSVIRPPARLRELLGRWLITADPDGYADRRRTGAQDDADVELWKRDTGLVDLVARSLSAPDAQACADRIEQLAAPTGPDDARTAGQRRRQALVDLLTGRITLPFGNDAPFDSEPPIGCCPLGSAAPCGAQIFVHVPLATALGEGTEPAELVGHGPIDPVQLAELLATAPVMHRVWVNAHGTPVGVDDRSWTPDRGDSLPALRDLATGPRPAQRHPTHPDDHPPDASDPPPEPHARIDVPRVLTRPHLADPGSYRPNKRQRRLLRARAPRCEWPGCGRRASHAAGSPCDLDHDLAWPFGPTCACNLGPACRRHHRIKQLGWTKHRQADGSTRWTSPTGRTWTSPNQHGPLTGPSRDASRRRQIAPGVWTLAA